MIRITERNDAALTGLEIVIILVIIICAGAFIMTNDSDGTRWINHLFPEGLVAESMYETGDSIQPAGETIGFSAVSPGAARLPVSYLKPDPARMGSVQLTVSLFIGDTGPVDMDCVNVTWSTTNAVEVIRKNESSTLVCPNWTIAGKNNMLPGQNADSDNWLEPGEQFIILVCPTESLAPYQTFTLSMYPDGVAVMPLRLTRTVPPGIQPVMNLG